MKRREALKNSLFLAGSTALATSMLSLLQSCESKSRLNWKPEFLKIHEAELISSIVDSILPKTETPGALDMNVDLFIDLVYGKLYNKKAQIKMSEELDQLNARSINQFKKDFVELSTEQKKQFLMTEEANCGKYNAQVWGTAIGQQSPVGFYRTLKSLAIWAYFSSKEIGMNVLSYDPIPGPYQGCIPLSNVGNSWSL